MKSAVLFSGVFLVSSALPFAMAADKAEPLTAEFVECKDSEGTFFKLVRQSDQTYELQYGGIFRLDFEGKHRVKPTVVSKGLKCSLGSNSLEAISCVGSEEQTVSAPRTGKYGMKVTRESSFRVGMEWLSIKSFDPAYSGPNKALGLRANFRIGLNLGEIREDIPVQATHVATGKKTELYLNTSQLDLSVDQSVDSDEPSGCVMKD